ncbi:MAG: hypothetical protein SWK76_01205 [Actinomycetota bacterium]|nr:hypothetical protein [Actinomycetota bacterium]
MTKGGKDGHYALTPAWHGERVKPWCGETRGIDLSAFSWSMEKIYKNHYIDIEDAVNLPCRALPEKRTLDRSGIRPLAAMPLRERGSAHHTRFVTNATALLRTLCRIP